MSDRRLVLITWIDPTSGTHGWKDIKEVVALKLPETKSVGWVILEAEGYITLIAHFNTEDQVDGEVVIPHSCITSIVDLEPKT
jgi:hypothetical protein